MRTPTELVLEHYGVSELSETWLFERQHRKQGKSEERRAQNALVVLGHLIDMRVQSQRVFKEHQGGLPFRMYPRKCRELRGSSFREGVSRLNESCLIALLGVGKEGFYRTSRGRLWCCFDGEFAKLVEREVMASRQAVTA